MAKTNENWLVGVVIGLGVFFLVILMIFFLRGFLDNKKMSGAGNNSIKNSILGRSVGDFSLQQAYLICKSKVKSMTHLNIHSLRLDSRSSRFDAEANEFIVFLDIDLIRDESIVDEFAKCHVSVTDNTIAEFRLKSDRGFLSGW
ncbi:MAG: hypothetical protein HRU38_12155 [Saccharospirillaceae bacterium]|nr:hypothetical protein [Saccharospirillaceae bacterium]